MGENGLLARLAQRLDLTQCSLCFDGQDRVEYAIDVGGVFTFRDDLNEVSGALLGHFSWA